MRLGWLCALVLVSTPVSAQVRVGPGPAALPAIGSVTVAERPVGTVTSALELGYQVIEPLAEEAASHHGASATLGVGAPLGDWVSVGLALRGLVMTHPADRMGSDTSGTGFPVLALRVMDTRQPLSYGVVVEGIFPGRDAPSVDFAATTVRASGVASYAPVGSSWAYALNLGYQVDNSAHAAPPIATLRQGDRTALGASSYDAVLAGFAIAHSNGDWLLFGEASAEVLYGAPRPTTSPLRVGVGARYAVTEAVQFELRAQVGLSARARFDSENYQPYEPRFAVLLGPRVAWGAPSHEPVQPILQPEQSPSPERTPEAEAPRANIVRSLEGVVTDEAGVRLSQVTITASVGDWSATTETDANGAYRLSGVPPGDVRLSARTVDYEPAETKVDVAVDVSESEVAPIVLQVQVLGAQLEGVVRGFDGKIPQATVTLTPGELSAATDADGKFSLDVGPGEYRVTVSAPGYESQTRHVKVQNHGVVIVNVDLRKR